MAKLRFHGDIYENNNRVINVSNASGSDPLSPGVADPGLSTAYARADHVHPPQDTINGHTVNADVPSGASFDDTTYTFAEGSTDGTFTVTPSSGSAQTVTVHGVRSLPVVTASDNGKFLRVANGVWSVESISAAAGESF